MFKHQLIHLYIYYTLLVACGVRAVQADSVGPYIINGDLAKRGAWPWHVSVFYQGSYHCGGSIVNSKWILIAAHCANSYS